MVFQQYLLVFQLLNALFFRFFLSLPSYSIPMKNLVAAFTDHLKEAIQISEETHRPGGEQRASRLEFSKNCCVMDLMSMNRSREASLDHHKSGRGTSSRYWLLGVLTCCAKHGSSRSHRREVSEASKLNHRREVSDTS